MIVLYSYGRSSTVGPVQLDLLVVLLYSSAGSGCTAVQPDFDPVVELIRPIPTTGFLKVAKTAHSERAEPAGAGAARYRHHAASQPASGAARAGGGRRPGPPTPRPTARAWPCALGWTSPAPLRRQMCPLPWEARRSPCRYTTAFSRARCTPKAAPPFVCLYLCGRCAFLHSKLAR